MLGFLEFLTEATQKQSAEPPKPYESTPTHLGAGADERAVAALWNHVIEKHGNTSAKDLHQKLLKDIEQHFSSKGQRHHHLSVMLHNDHISKAWQNRPANAAWRTHLERAARVVHDLANHEDYKKARKSKLKASVAGNTHTGELSDIWKSHGATNRTSKADILIGDPEHRHHGRISLKHGRGAQIASMEPSQFMATIDHAAHTAGYKRGSKEHKDILRHAESIAASMSNMSKRNPNAKTDNRDQDVARMNSVMTAMTTKYSRLKKAIVREAITGHGQFGKNSTSTATHVVTYGNGDTSIKHVNQINPGLYRLRTAKGKGLSGGKHRPGAIRIDWDGGK